MHEELLDRLAIRDLVENWALWQTRIGYDVKPDMPQLTGPEVEVLYLRGQAWLRGEALQSLAN